MRTPLIHKKLQMEKIPGKGGWTFVRLPGISKDKRAHFGTIRVNGTVDGFELKHYNLFPMKDGHMFLPVKAAIRKQIKKDVGDLVEVILYADYDIIEVAGNFQLCLEDEPKALQKFKGLSEEEKIRLIKWIEEPLSDDARVERMAKAITSLAGGLPLPHL